MTGGTTTVRSLCANCDVANPQLAIDGAPATFATITYPDGTPGVGSIRAIAQEGVIYPPLSNPGAIVSFEGGEQSTFNSGLTLRMFLQDAPVGDSTTGSFTIVGGEGSSEPSTISFISIPPFDAVEVAFTRSGSGVRVLRIHEFCSDT